VRKRERNEREKKEGKGERRYLPSFDQKGKRSTKGPRPRERGKKRRKKKKKEV